jgi:hypothetical protein
MGQAGPGNDAMSRVRMIERRQDTAIGKQLVVIVLGAMEPLVDELFEAAAASDGLDRQPISGFRAAHRPHFAVRLETADTLAAMTILELNEQHL